MSSIRIRSATGLLTWYAIASGAANVVGAAEPTDAVSLPTVTVQATAIPGSSVALDEVPGSVQTVSAADLSRTGTADLTGTLNRQLGSINADDNLDDPFQPDILYRGFEASPVLGTSEGLAVYQDGVRINEAFGNTVNWDLIPSIAIDRATIVSASPVYGLNALGAGMSVSMKNGFENPVAGVNVSGGSFAQRAASAEYGVSSQQFGAYVAANVLDQNGWREFASDSVRQLYGVLSARTDHASINLSYDGAHNNLAGQGAAPVQELAISRWLVFTGPQANLDRLNFVTLNGSLKLTDSLSLQGVAYYRQYGQTVSNGNTTDYTACMQPPDIGSLCQSDGLTSLVNSAGQSLPDISNGGTTPIGENDFEQISAYGRGVALQVSDRQSIAARQNSFSAGATLDYALVDFYSGTQIGVIDPQLTVLPSNLIVDTPEGSAFGATPVLLRAANRFEGLYATDTFGVTDALSLTASGRYNIADIDLDDQRGTDLTGDNRYVHFNPALGATYRVSAPVTAYAGFAENTRTPTASEIECSNPLQPCLLPSSLSGDPPTLRQVVAYTYELGWRGQLFRTPGSAAADGTGRATAGPAAFWNLDVFRTELHDDIYGIATSVSSGFFQNIGATRRQGVELGLNYASPQWSAYLNYSYIDATFESPLLLPSPSNPYQDTNGNIQVEPGDRLPGIPQHRLKLGADYQLWPNWTVGGNVSVISNEYYFGDESNQNAPLPGHVVVGLHSLYRISRRVDFFVTLENLLNARYASYGVLSDPTGIGAPGVPADGITNGSGVDNRFQSPAAPFAVFAGVRAHFR